MPKYISFALNLYVGVMYNMHDTVTLCGELSLDYVIIFI